MHYAYCLHSFIHLYLVVIIMIPNSIIDHFFFFRESIDHFLDLKECQVLILKKKNVKFPLH